MARALDEALPAWTMVQMLPAAALLARRVGDAAVARQAIERYTREIDAGRARAGTVQCNLMSQLGHTLYTGQFAGPTYQGLTTFQAPIGGTSSLQIGLGASSFSRIGADTECVLRADRDITREAVQVWLGEAVFRMVNEDAAGGTRFLNRAIEGLHRLEHAFPGWSPDHAALAGGREDLDLRYLALAASAASQASHPFAGAELSRLSRQLGSPQSELPDSIPAAFDPFEAAHTLWSRVEEASKVAEMLQGRSEPSSSFASEGPFRETARLFRNLACDPRNLRGARRALSEERPFEAVSWALSALRRCGPDEDPGFEALLQEASSEAPPWIRALIWKHFGSPRGGSWLAWAEAVRGRAPPMLQTMVHLRALWERMKTPEPIWPVTRPLLEGLSGMGQIDRGERWWLEWTARTLDGTSLDDLKSSLDAFGPPKALAKATAGTEEALRSAMRTWTESRLRSLVQASQGGD
jgi:hypothetical protein